MILHYDILISPHPSVNTAAFPDENRSVVFVEEINLSYASCENTLCTQTNRVSNCEWKMFKCMPEDMKTFDSHTQSYVRALCGNMSCVSE